MLDADATGKADRADASGEILTPSTTPPVAASTRKTVRFSLRTLMIKFGLITCIVGISVATIRQVDLSNRSSEIKHALSSIEGWHRHFITDEARKGRALSPLQPPGQPISWRLRLMPDDFVTAFKADVNTPWDAPVNRQLATFGAQYYCLTKKAGATATNVFGITGPDTALETDFMDWDYQAILAMEIADSETHWMQPGDYDVTQLLAATGRLGDTVKGLLPDRIHLLFADGEVWALSPDTPIDAVKPFFTIAGAKKSSREDALTPYRRDQP